MRSLRGRYQAGVRHLGFALLLLALPLGLAACGGGRADGPRIVADPSRTPGALNPDVTQETIAATVCVTGWTATIRPPQAYTDELKRRQMAEYGERGSGHDVEEDHFIPLSIGGHPTDPRNLWPEPRPRADEVDKLELDLHEAVCAGELTLAEAQARIAREKWTRG